MAEGLGSGLQIRVRRFKSGHHLHLIPQALLNLCLDISGNVGFDIDKSNFDVCETEIEI